MAKRAAHFRHNVTCKTLWEPRAGASADLPTLSALEACVRFCLYLPRRAAIWIFSAYYACPPAVLHHRRAARRGKVFAVYLITALPLVHA